jgi:antitoxin HigA-1
MAQIQFFMSVALEPQPRPDFAATLILNSTTKRQWLMQQKRNSNRCPTHPGALLREDMIPAVQRTVAEMAELLGISRKRVRPDVAARLGRFFGDGPGIWLRMQADYDAWHVKHDVDVSSFPTLRAA